jgi:hypothetical protein
MGEARAAGNTNKWEGAAFELQKPLKVAKLQVILVDQAVAMPLAVSIARARSMAARGILVGANRARCY